MLRVTPDVYALFKRLSTEVDKPISTVVSEFLTASAPTVKTVTEAVEHFRKAKTKEAEVNLAEALQTVVNKLREGHKG